MMMWNVEWKLEKNAIAMLQPSIQALALAWA